MTTQLELIRDALTIKKLAREIPMSTEMLDRVDKLADAFLDANLPRIEKPKEEAMDAGVSW